MDNMQNFRVVYPVVYTPGPKRDGLGDDDVKRIQDEHVAYQIKAFERGFLLQGGPFSDHKSGLAIFNAESISEVEDYVNNDPSVKAGLYEIKVYEWQIVLNVDD